MQLDVCPLSQHLPKRGGRQGSPTWEESETVQDELVSIWEKWRVEMMCQGSCARAPAVPVQFLSLSQAQGLHIPCCTFTHSPAPTHLGGETTRLRWSFSTQTSRHQEVEIIWPFLQLEALEGGKTEPLFPLTLTFIWLAAVWGGQHVV